MFEISSKWPTTLFALVYCEQDRNAQEAYEKLMQQSKAPGCRCTAENLVVACHGLLVLLSLTGWSLMGEVKIAKRQLFLPFFLSLFHPLEPGCSGYVFLFLALAVSISTLQIVKAQKDADVKHKTTEARHLSCAQTMAQFCQRGFWLKNPTKNHATQKNMGIYQNPFRNSHAILKPILESTKTWTIKFK